MMSFIKYQKEFLLVMTSIIHPKAVIWWGNFLHYYVYLIVQWTIYNLSIHPSISPSINLCINQSICKSINQSINQFSYEFCPVCIIITFILPHCCEDVIGQIMLQICFLWSFVHFNGYYIKTKRKCNLHTIVWHTMFLMHALKATWET